MSENLSRSKPQNPVTTECDNITAQSLFPFVLKLNAWVLFVLSLGIATAPFIPHGPFVHGPGLGGQLRAFDGMSYYLIATHGYHWDPRLGETFGHGQSIAFFPAFPLLEAMLDQISQSPWVMIATGLFFGFWSNLAFAQLAHRLLPADAARLATICFALWPANCFLVMDYPVGLSNLCAASCLFNYVADRRLKSVLWCGLGTAASPTMLFVAAALCLDLAIDWLHGARRISTAARTILFGGISFAGLFAFMTYQDIAFHDPFAFHEAQRGWFPETLPPLAHIMRLLNVAWYLFPLQFSAGAIAGLVWNHAWASVTGRESLVIAWDLDVDLLALLAAVFFLSKCSTKSKWRLLSLSGWSLVAGYLWFLGTSSYNLMNGLRALYPVCILFLGLGMRVSAHPRYTTLLIGVVSLASVIDMTLIASGYGII